MTGSASSKEAVPKAFPTKNSTHLSVMEGKIERAAGLQARNEAGLVKRENTLYK